MNRFRFVLNFFCGAAIQASAAMLSRIIGSNFTFPFNINFFLSWIGISLGTMMICLCSAVIIERLFVIRRLWSHVITAIVLTTLAVIYQVWNLGGRDVLTDTTVTLALSMVVSLVTLAVRRFSGNIRGAQ